MDDLISRQAAIDGAKRLSLGETDATRLAMRTEDYMERLQSAQPDSHCNTCRYRNLEWCEEPCDSCTMGGESNHYKPSAQPEQQWIPCSECEKRCSKWENSEI